MIPLNLITPKSPYGQRKIFSLLCFALEGKEISILSIVIEQRYLSYVSSKNHIMDDIDDPCHRCFGAALGL
jgi:hypothetical protein